MYNSELGAKPTSQQSLYYMYRAREQYKYWDSAAGPDIGYRVQYIGRLIRSQSSSPPSPSPADRFPLYTFVIPSIFPASVLYILFCSKTLAQSSGLLYNCTVPPCFVAIGSLYFVPPPLILSGVFFSWFILFLPAFILFRRFFVCIYI